MSNLLYIEHINDPILQSRTALTAAIIAMELIARHPSMQNHLPDCGGLLAYYRWCAEHEDNALGCLALARMARDELALLEGVPLGKARDYLATAQQQTERLIAVLAPLIPEVEGVGR